MDRAKEGKNISNCYKKSQNVLYNLMFSSLVALTCSFLCSYPFWFSSLTSSMKHSLFISLPNIWSKFLNPKCLFIVFNVIVAFLVGESKLLGSHKASPVNDIYSEYVERARNLRREKKCLESGSIREESDVINRVYEDKEIVLVENKEEDDDHEEFEEADKNNDEIKEEKGGEFEKEKEEDQCADGLPVEELNRRVEEFIARINKQRWIEARMVICGQA